MSGKKGILRVKTWTNVHGRPHKYIFRSPIVHTLYEGGKGESIEVPKLLAIVL